MKEKISACEGKCLGVFIKERRFSAGPEVFPHPEKRRPETESLTVKGPYRSMWTHGP